jgi:hypothetical protein
MVKLQSDRSRKWQWKSPAIKPLPYSGLTILDAGRKLNEKQNTNALLAVPVIGIDGYDSGVIAPNTARKTVQTHNLGAVPCLHRCLVDLRW